MDISVMERQLHELVAWKIHAERRLVEMEQRLGHLAGRHGEHAEAVAQLMRTVSSERAKSTPPQEAKSIPPQEEREIKAARSPKA